MQNRTSFELAQSNVPPVLRTLGAVSAFAALLMLSACPDRPVAEDGGANDTGASDGGAIDDAGVENDAGPGTPADSGVEDAGANEDAGNVDAGDIDAGNDGGAQTDGGNAGGVDAGPVCTTVADCNLGFLCVSGDCVPGCEDTRDCPTDLLCNVNADDNGRCEQCLSDDNCIDDQVCSNGTCRDGCSEAVPGCPGVQICDIPNQVCVRCLEDANCGLGTICEAQDCVEGCRSTRDCPEGNVCIEGQCGEGCEAAPDDNCPVGTHCNALAVCEVGCNGDDGQCGASQICEADVCIDACVNSDECGTNETCLDNECVSGCIGDAGDCDFGVCIAEAGEFGSCEQCANDNDCNVVNPTCDLDSFQCRRPCTVNGFCLGQVCDVVSDLCVDCLIDDHCGELELCNVDVNQCEPAPLPAAPFCGRCDGDDDCTNGACVLMAAGNFGGVERVCGLDCGTDGACPQGTECTFLEEEGVIVAEQCVPVTSAQAVTSCTAFLNAVSEAACSFTNACGPAGAPFNGVCVPAGGGAGICSLACNVDVDCPDAFSCTGAPVIGSPPNTAGVCEPVQP